MSVFLGSHLGSQDMIANLDVLVYLTCAFQSNHFWQLQLQGLVFLATFERQHTRFHNSTSLHALQSNLKTYLLQEFDFLGPCLQGMTWTQIHLEAQYHSSGAYLHPGQVTNLLQGFSFLPVYLNSLLWLECVSKSHSWPSQSMNLYWLNWHSSCLLAYCSKFHFSKFEGLLT